MRWLLPTELAQLPPPRPLRHLPAPVPAGSSPPPAVLLPHGARPAAVTSGARRPRTETDAVQVGRDASSHIPALFGGGHSLPRLVTVPALFGSGAPPGTLVSLYGGENRSRTMRPPPPDPLNQPRPQEQRRRGGSAMRYGVRR
uniref:Uncharacterized protein n=1 Tax=Setaria viridis TaxID=4556 RepID=A0A4U6US47_SETVI|nr:hypothetical protein SEVIR_5G437900v2 [Setaria viridis]